MLPTWVSFSLPVTKGLRFAEMLGNGPLAWNGQREAWGFSN